MQEHIRQLFERNIELLELTDKAVLYFREQNYEAALDYMPIISDKIRFIIDGIVGEKDYFELVSTDSLMEMLEGILDAGRSTDYVLLADLLELQLTTLLCNVQELIMQKEDFPTYSESVYLEQCNKMKRIMLRDNKEEVVTELFSEPLNPQELLDFGYRVEFTSCGLMTIAVGTGNGASVYLHTNHKVSQEAFLLARTWIQKNSNTYLVKGFGMGYHILELIKLVPDVTIEIYESNLYVLKLACAFAPIHELLENENLHLVYDPDGTRWEERCKEKAENETICIHGPSQRVQAHNKQI